MAMRLPILLRLVVQRSYVTCGLSSESLKSIQWVRRSGYKIYKSQIALPSPVSSSCRRFQHSQSADPDDTDLNHEEPRRRRPKPHEVILNQIIEKGEPLSAKQWEEVEETLLTSSHFINKENMYGIIMGMCLASKKFAVGNSLFEALKERNSDVNIATLSSFLKLCSICNVGEEKEILSIVDEIREKCPVLDSTIADRVIHGLALTSRWREGFDLLADIHLTSVPFVSTFAVLSKAAIDHGDMTKGFGLMEEMVQKNMQPPPVVYNAWIDQAWKASGREGHILIGQLLEFWADNEVRPSWEVVTHLRRWFERDRYSWEGTFTSLTPWGSCMNCGTRMRKAYVSPKQFEAMRDHFFEQVLVGSNVFLKTNPEELETFQQFLSRTVPYDVVVDGLNVAYCTGMLQPPVAAKVLQSVVKQLVEQGQKVLVLGRRHMQNWPKPEMRYIHDSASVFLAQNISQDDPFLLYAAMFSGQRTTFVSRDLMRSHKSLLKDQSLKKIFRLWQQHNQMRLRPIGRWNATVMPALRFNPTVQQGPGSVWHIPYDQEYSVKPKQLYDAPLHWLCLRKGGEVD